VVCDVPALLTNCVDLLAPVNTRVTYSVRATFREWVGRHSERSNSVRVPFGLAAPSVAGLTAADTIGPEAPLPGGGTSAPGKATPQSGQKAATAADATPPGTAQPSATQAQPDPTPSADAQLGTAPPVATEPEKAKPETPPVGSAPQVPTKAAKGRPAAS
jgi:hypothetical protein